MKTESPHHRCLKGWGYTASQEDRQNKELVPDDAIWGTYVNGGSLVEPVYCDGYVVEADDLRQHVTRTGHLPSLMVQEDHSGSAVYVRKLEWTPCELIAWRDSVDMRGKCSHTSPCEVGTTFADQRPSINGA